MIDLISEAFRPAQNSLDWAKSATDEFHAEIAKFLGEPNFCTSVTEFDMGTGEHVQKLRLTKPLPGILNRRFNEALVSSKASLDQATNAARDLTSKRKKGLAYYPWSQNPTDMKRLLDARGIDENLWPVFSDHQPYPTGDEYRGGNTYLRSLAQLVNDRHTIGLSVWGDVSGIRTPDIVNISGYTKVGLGWWDPKKNEMEVARWTGETSIDGEYSIRFQIVLNDPRFPQPVDARSALYALTRTAESFLQAIEAKCRELAT